MIIRLLDIFFSVVGLILLSPIFAIISILIKFDSNGSVFYTQERIGKDYKPFLLLKFRTMYLDADKKGLLTVGKRDPRITKIGYNLRKYKIDEFPQLINVLLGEMSLVGPRPEVSKYVKYYTNEQKRILSIRPGMTDYASISFFDENALLIESTDPEEMYIKSILPEKINLNLIYVNNLTIINYFKIIILTIVKIIKR